jgi:DEAD/DEAH box helicase domain-containing protein
MVASASPLDQFLAHHPEYFFERSPEQALVNPDHLLILLEHLRCAMFELPFQKGEGFGSLSGEVIDEYLQYLLSNNEVHLQMKNITGWRTSIPLRIFPCVPHSPQSCFADNSEERPKTIGTVDSSALWMVHPGAIYLHESAIVLRKDLNAEEHRLFESHPSDYYTEPLRHRK